MRYDNLKNQADSLPDTIEIQLDRRAAVLLFDKKPEFWDYWQWLNFCNAAELAYQRELNRRLSFAYQANAASLSQPSGHSSRDKPRPALHIVQRPNIITVKLDRKTAYDLLKNKPDSWTYSQHEDYKIAYAGASGRELRQRALAEERAAKAEAIAAAKRPTSKTQFRPDNLAA